MSGSDKKCCVPGCVADRDSHQVLHRFPNPNKDRQRFNNWIISIGGEILSLTNEHIHRYRRICNKHFPGEYLCRYGRISNIAVPTLYLTGTFKLPGNLNGQSYLEFLQNDLPNLLDEVLEELSLSIVKINNKRSSQSFENFDSERQSPCLDFQFMKQNELDVGKLLETHFGQNWASLVRLNYYNKVLNGENIISTWRKLKKMTQKKY